MILASGTGQNDAGKLLDSTGTDPHFLTWAESIYEIQILQIILEYVKKTATK